MECPKCKTEPQHGSCVCDEVLVKDLKAERDELKRVVEVLAEECANRSRFMSTAEEWIEWAEAKAKDGE